MCFHVLTLDHLAKRSLAQDIKDQISCATLSTQISATYQFENLLVPLVSPQPVIHIEDVIIVLVVESVIV